MRLESLKAREVLMEITNKVWLIRRYQQKFETAKFGQNVAWIIDQILVNTVHVHLRTQPSCTFFFLLPSAFVLYFFPKTKKWHVNLIEVEPRGTPHECHHLAIIYSFHLITLCASLLRIRVYSIRDLVWARLKYRNNSLTIFLKKIVISSLVLIRRYYNYT